MLLSQYARKERPPQTPRRNKYAKFSKSQEFLGPPKQLTNKREDELKIIAGFLKEFLLAIQESINFD